MQSSCQILEMIENIRAAAQTSGGTGTGAPNGTVLMLDSSVPSEASPEKVITILIRSFLSNADFYAARSNTGYTTKAGPNSIVYHVQHVGNQPFVFYQVWWHQSMVKSMNILGSLCVLYNNVFIGIAMNGPVWVGAMHTANWRRSTTNLPQQQVQKPPIW